MGGDPRQNHQRDPDEPQHHAVHAGVVRAQHDVVHVAPEARDRHQRHVRRDEVDKPDHHEEVNRPRSLPPAEQPHVTRKAADQRRRHGHARQNRQRRHDEDRREIHQLLERVVSVEAVRLRRQMEIRVADERVPRLHEDAPRRRHQPHPLIAGQQPAHKEESGEHESVDVQKMPAPADPNRMAVARRSHQRRNVPVVIFRGPQPVARHFQRRKPDPFAPRRAAVVEIKPRMIHQDRQSAADQHEGEEQIEEVRPANPRRKSVRPARRSGNRRRVRSNVGQPPHVRLNPRDGQRHEDNNSDDGQRRRANPDSEPAVCGVIDSTFRV